MADVFLTYSRQDQSIVERFLQVLQAEGYSVWWDTALVSGDRFRAQISVQIDAARAVIVIWSKNSVRSEWVLAEASKALNDGKLIAVRTSDLSFADVPAPFDVLHIESVEQPQRVLAALRVRLARSEQGEPDQAPAPSDVAKGIGRGLLAQVALGSPIQLRRRVGRRSLFVTEGKTAPTRPYYGRRASQRRTWRRGACARHSKGKYTTRFEWVESRPWGRVLPQRRNDRF